MNTIKTWTLHESEPQTYKELKEKVRDLDNLPTGSLNTVLRRGFDEKASLNSLLGHSEENGYRTLLSFQITEDEWLNLCPTHNSLKRELIKNIDGDITCSRNEVILRGDTQPRKLTRIIAGELNKWKCSHPLYDWVTRRGYEKHTAMQRFGEMFNAKSTTRIVISTNPFDFITSSGRYWDKAAYTSCHDWEGCHFSGNMSYINDRITLLMYIADAKNLDYKVGRSWVYLPEQGKAGIVQPKSYGTFNTSHRKIGREYLEYLLDPKGDWKSHEISSINVEESGANYVDNYALTFAYNRNTMDKDEVPSLLFAPAICLECGAEHYRTAEGVCNDCSTNTCECCGNEAETTDPGGDPICWECYNERWVDCGCGRTVDKDSATWIDSCDEYVCQRCLDKNYSHCYECEEYRDSDDVYRCDDGEYRCTHCLENRGWLSCDKCGEYSQETHYMVDCRNDLCPGCAPDAAECVECGDYFNEVEEVEGDPYCPGCAEAKRIELAEEEEVDNSDEQLTLAA